jgi:single-stranded DNA-binding protein
MADTHVTLTGNLTDGPELKFTPNGNPGPTSAWPSPPGRPHGSAGGVG